jgi:general secretion pathway protein A
MYNQFFGFKERPFKLIPDPDYLFLSKSHEEALAYLKYAVAEEEGFVEIIGEVGTGKTMLCRAFLENLGSDVESAYIFNPKLNATELLQAIIDEFGISADGNEAKSLIDALNSFLMEKRAEGKKAILIIDEAQNLSKEVLEQIRLLSNLETTKNKLLQIILVGQPELFEMLDSYELRQLGQRISLICRLKPLTYSETKQYIEHRIHVASSKPAAPFSRAAIRRIHRYSGGIPRLINIACDRALLAAYGFNSPKVSGNIARAAVLELLTRGDSKLYAAGYGRKKVLTLLSLCLVLVLVLVYQSNIKLILANIHPSIKFFKPSDYSEKVTPLSPKIEPHLSDDGAAWTPVAPALVEPSQSTDSHIENQPTIKTETPDFVQLLSGMTTENSRPMAIKAVLNQWEGNDKFPDALDIIKDDGTFFSLAARQQGLILQDVKGSLGLIRNLNLCTIMQFKHPVAQKYNFVYLTAVSADNDSMTFSDDSNHRLIKVENDNIIKYWTGQAFVFWKNFYNYQGIIPLSSPGESLITLKLHLRGIGFSDVDINPTYDDATQAAIKTLQARHAILVDGYVGPLTKIILYNETPALPIPHLLKNGVF